MRQRQEAEQHFTTALHRNALPGAHPWSVSARNEYAVMLLQRRYAGYLAKAREHVAQAAYEQRLDSLHHDLHEAEQHHDLAWAGILR